MAVTQPPPASGRSSPAFILSFPRSGTTLLGHVLAMSDEVALLEEPQLLTQIAAEFVESPDGIARLASLAEDALERYRAQYRTDARRLGADPDKKLVVDQTALNTIHLPAIRRFFPESPVIFVIRDPRDVVFSCFRRQFEPTPFTLEFHSLESTARFYDRMMRLADTCREKTGLETFDIRYEDVVADFDSQTQRLCARLGIAWAPQMREFHRAAEGRTLVTRSAPQIRRGLNSDSVGAWRRYREQMMPVLPALAPWVERFGYSRD